MIFVINLILYGVTIVMYFMYRSQI